ncbi:MAG: M1 family aminopeptidase, partial [Gemmatimonadales bacterium]
MPSCFHNALPSCIGLLSLLPAGLHAQVPSEPTPAATYAERYAEVARLAPLPGQVASVEHLVLAREAGQLILEHGELYLLSPIGGRTVGAVFRGTGRFLFAPSLGVEQSELQRFAHTTMLDDTLSEVVLLFADSTPHQLRGLSFAPAQVPGGIAGDVTDLVKSLKGDHDGAFDGGVMGPMLNGDAPGYFLALVTRTHGDPVLFVVDPQFSESVRLCKPANRRLWGASWALVNQFAADNPLPGSSDAWRFRSRLEVPGYRIDLRLSEAVSGNLGLAATATLAVAAVEPIGPWLQFSLDGRLRLDSARWADGGAAAFFKAEDYEDLWVRAPHRLARGDTLSLTLFYHGDMIDRYADFFFVDPAAEWYPHNAQGGGLATFDVTYHAPARYPLISVGEHVDSSVSEHVATSRWVTREPTYAVSFNLGLFENYHVQHPGAPPLDVFISEDAHRLMRRASAMNSSYTEQAHMKENVAVDVSNSLMFYGTLFGPSPLDHFTVTEIPYGEGVSFPGLIHLSWSTFQNTSLDGFDEFFRAHEAAHQWWGNGVRPSSYRDAWLSEGLASYSALSYLRSERHHDDEYNRFLDQYRDDIASDLDAGPIWIGYRAASPSVRRGYDVMVYEKGAWVFHMLRVLMTDIR